jgi:DNA-binding CsgD family transcriptional regulator
MDGFPLDSVLASLPLHVFVLTTEGRIRYANRADPGRKLGDIVGRNFSSFFPPDEVAVVASALKRAMHSGQEQTFAADVLDADGARRRYNFTLAPFFERGRPNGVIGWACDMAENGGMRPAKEAQARVKQLTPRQRAVLTFVAQGLSNRRIARRLAVSVRTVETHREQLSAKLGLRGAAALTRFALAARML